MSIRRIRTLTAPSGDRSPWGERVFLATANFIVPEGVTSICAVGIGHGGAAQLPDGTYYRGQIRIGDVISLKRGATILLSANPGAGGVYGSTEGGAGGTGGVKEGGGDGGRGGRYNVDRDYVPGGGGAGGYLGYGGNGGDQLSNLVTPEVGSGGAAGGTRHASSGQAKGGGGVGLYGIGSNGTSGSNGGSGGENGTGYNVAPNNWGSEANKVPRLGGRFGGGSAPIGNLIAGGGGGENSWVNNIAVTPGETLVVTIGWPGATMETTYPNSSGHGLQQFAATGALRIIWGKGRSFPYNAA